MRIATDENMIPLTPQTYHILLALAHRPLHGYSILQQTELDSGGTSHFARAAFMRR